MEHFDIAINIVLLPVCIFAGLMIHELGHYILARFYKISIDSFSIGCGRNVWKYTDKRGVDWIFNLFPISGHVNLSSSRAKKGTTLFRKAPPSQQTAVVMAGPAANIIAAFFLIFLFYIFIGQPVRSTEISGVEPDQPGAVAGLETGDVIIEVEGEPVTRYRELWRYTWNMPEVPLDLKVKRGEEVFETVLTPALIEYRDERGIDRSHGRMAVLIGHARTDLMNVKSVNGAPIEAPAMEGASKEEQAEKEREAVRNALIPLLGQHVQLGLRSDDGEVHLYDTYLSPELNAHLHDPDHIHYKIFFSGYVKDNIYRPLGMMQSLREASGQTGMFISGLARLPFQLLPMDKKLIRPWVVVYDIDRYALGKFYEFTYRVALVCVFLALLNLVPFPGLDGSMLIQIGLRHLAGVKEPEKSRGYKYTVLTLLSFLYLAILVANIDDLPRYLEKKISSVTEENS